MKITDVITEAANSAQQAAIAISMKKAGKKPKQGVAEGWIDSIASKLNGKSDLETINDRRKKLGYDPILSIPKKKTQTHPAYDEGLKARTAGWERDDNPYLNSGKPAEFAWDKGWVDSKQGIVEGWKETFAAGMRGAKAGYDKSKADRLAPKKETHPAYNQGVEAGSSGWERDDNPYLNTGRSAEFAWDRGWKASSQSDSLDALKEEFDLIESIVEQIAEHNGVDAEAVWEDLESLTEDELYVFAVTSDPLMESEAWQKANKRDKTDGMSQKAVNTYRREHPGSKLKTAVTTKPSKLKKGSKASKRRSSYCSRSRGQMKMHSISCAKTPDKAICKARRRWNC
jgi:hypothetical protein